jgi:hypothetical protein
MLATIMESRLNKKTSNEIINSSVAQAPPRISGKK